MKQGAATAVAVGGPPDSHDAEEEQEPKEGRQNHPVPKVHHGGRRAAARCVDHDRDHPGDDRHNADNGN
jgi:hypothetical protein